MAATCISALTLLLLLLCPSVFGAVCNEISSLNITTPKFLEALSGSCLKIPCNFKPILSSPHNTFNVSAPVFGVWIKTDFKFGQNPENVIFNSSKLNNRYPMNVTGNLKKKECTTLFNNLSTEYSDTYYFRIENKPFFATAVCDPLQINVTDSPWIPSIEVSGDQTETEVVTITCSAVTPCPRAPPKLTWDLHQGTANIKETNSDGTFTTKISLNITLTDSHDGLMIKCNASYPVSGGFKMADSDVTLSVSYGPKDTSVVVSPSGSLSAGQSVTLSCSSRAKPPVHHFTWFRRSSQGTANVSEGQTYSFNFTEEGEYYCVASNALGNKLSPVIQLRTKDTTSALPWEAILGAGVGLIIAFCLAVILMCIRSKRQASKETQMETFVESDKAEEEEETLHYGEIDFSNLSPKEVSNTEQEETVYSQVQVSKTVNANNTQPPEDDLYANVNKK